MKSCLVNEWLAVGGLGTAFATAAGAVLKTWLEAKIKDEARARAALQDRIGSLESRLSGSLDIISKLQLDLLAKAHEMHVLQIKYEGLVENYQELLERYKASEEMARKLLNEMVPLRRRLSTPPSFSAHQPHHNKKGEGP